MKLNKENILFDNIIPTKRGLSEITETRNSDFESFDELVSKLKFFNYKIVFSREGAFRKVGCRAILFTENNMRVEYQDKGETFIQAYKNLVGRLQSYCSKMNTSDSKYLLLSNNKLAFG